MKLQFRRPHIDIDQLLIFFLLAVTIDQAGYWLGKFAPEGRSFIGYLHAGAVDLAIWRSGWWLRKYSGRKQRRWAFAGVVVFSLVSAGYNFGYYTMRNLDMPWPLNALMAVVLPAAVALLSYLYGQKDVSQHSTNRDQTEPSEEPAPAAPLAAVPVALPFACPRCEARFATQQALAGHTRAHRNGHGSATERIDTMTVIASCDDAPAV